MRKRKYSFGLEILNNYYLNRVRACKRTLWIYTGVFLISHNTIMSSVTHIQTHTHAHPHTHSHAHTHTHTHTHTRAYIHTCCDTADIC